MSILDLEKPVWFMRQAGRHLPEYRKLRSLKRDFLEFCFDKDCIVESTLQPIRRYKIDTAIIFSDILIVPYILNQNLKFVKGEGPKLEALDLNKLIELEVNQRKEKNLCNTYKAINEVRRKMNKNKSLIGFCGGPWTVACYMINGVGDGKFYKPLKQIKENKDLVNKLLNKIVKLSINHLYKQYENGCDTLMIFESWAGLVPYKEHKNILIDPVNRIIKGIKEKGVLAPVIVLPRGINKKVVNYVNNVMLDILSVDYKIDIRWVIKNIQRDIVLQGNLDPHLIKAGGVELEKATKDLILATKGRRHIFCSGHGLLPDTPYQNVQKIIDIVKNRQCI